MTDSGLDPMVRREILEKMVAYCADYGTTVFFSSHLIDDIERLADTVGIICKGRLVIHDEKQKVRESLKRVTVSAGREGCFHSGPSGHPFFHSEKREWECILKPRKKRLSNFEIPNPEHMSFLK